MTLEVADEVRLVPDRQQDYHLTNAAREVERAGLYDIPIVDTDCHCYETSCLPEILRYMENPNIKRGFEASSPEFIQATVLPQNIGERTVGGRLNIGGGTKSKEGVHPLLEKDGMHPVAATTVLSMEAMAIDYSIVLPTPMLNIGVHPDIDVQNDMTWGFNRWLNEDVLPSDRRLLSMPLLPIADVDATMRNIEAFHDMPGVVGFMITCLQYQPLHQNKYMKVFKAIDDLGLPLAFHSAPYWYERPFAMLNKFLGAHALGFPFYAMVHMTNVVLAGLPERFPNIKWIFMEAGQAWVPFTMARLDNEYKQRSAEAPLLERLPSEYIRDFYFSTQPFEHYPDPQQTRDMIEVMNGANSLLYSSDYPHQDFDTPLAIWDEPRFTEEEKRKILGETALELFKLDRPNGTAPA